MDFLLPQQVIVNGRSDLVQQSNLAHFQHLAHIVLSFKVSDIVYACPFLFQLLQVFRLEERSVFLIKKLF